jgi:glutamine---fructose-6-phosphate transaminase (isomerizing)
MCGIVGYVGERVAAGVVLDALRRLEYRGYDSAGLAVLEEPPEGGAPRLTIVRAVGKLDNLAQAISARDLPGTVGLGHTRWATHGRPSEANAHPHRSGGVAVVHNGIIENHLELKQRLAAEGVQFQSDTDTEIVAHLIARSLGAHADPEQDLRAAFVAALRQIRGSYALGVVSERTPNLLLVAKSASPLVIGLGDGETLAASDIPALLSYTRRVILLEDGEIATLTRSGARIERLDGSLVERAERRVDWSPVQAEKGGYKHFMLKEIFEQPRAIEDTLRGRLHLEDGSIPASELGLDLRAIPEVRRVIFLACGTSFHASLVGRQLIEKFARLPAWAELASEVRYRSPVFGQGDLVVAVSQSGETVDTLHALDEAKRQGATILALTNVLDSAISRAADGAFYTHAGPEIGVASTKAFTTQLVLMLMLAVELGRERGTLGPDEISVIQKALLELPGQLRKTLERHDAVLEVARKWHQAKHMLFLGRGLSYPIALEGALKLKEISYAHAEGYAAGEMKHGPIALIDEEMPVLVLLPRDHNYEKTLSNLEEVRARDGRVIAVATDGDTHINSLTPDVLFVPKVHDALMPLVLTVPLQLLAYYIADLKGTDVDQPRNLAKTVTVE